MQIKEIKGIGEKTERVFQRAGINQVEDLLTYYPRFYDTFEEPVLVSELQCDYTAAVYATVVREPIIRRVRKLTILQAFLRDDQGNGFVATWFNAPFLKSKLPLGSKFVFRGLVKEKNAGFVMDQPKIFGMQEYQRKMGEMQPVYPLVSGLTNLMVQKSVKQAFSLLAIDETLPLALLDEYQLLGRKEALYQIHYPTKNEEMAQARKRLVFEEFFTFIHHLRRLKNQDVKISNCHRLDEPQEVRQLIDSLPYRLTNAQLRTWNEILNDFQSDHVMNRLVQGDVGSGKTIVAILSLLTVALNGEQGALMAPTEVLARQHYESINGLLEEHHIPCETVILVGSMTAKEKREAYEKITSGTVQIVIGTHALIQEKVQYQNLALVITDEQHRFGVRQRETFSLKGMNPHIMVMSATPIPRTLAIIMYGDLDISVIDELPANRSPIANCVVGKDYRPNAYDFMQKQIRMGRQVYVICPTVEFTEAVEGENVIEYAEKLRKIMPPSINVAYLHGRMKASEKNEIMERFSENQIQILVSTTVVEVGVNVPNATVMMVENAERFGLAQLHQLRGRVGRGEHQSYCIFLNGSGKKDATERLNILNQSNDGFFIASEDLRLRGPGDFFGVRQSGDYEFRLGDVMNDATILKMASDAWNKIDNEEIKVSEIEWELLNHEQLDQINI
ncbi:MAG: ATP-dependent DNA helicase RecG [Eubacterium sp.]|nr:ATP-dependent DNA helicase RecG [Eubacterium sp.]